MASLIDDLNELLINTRSVLEAAQSVADEIESSDPDLEMGLEDIIERERWSYSGLYHRTTQLNGTPTLLITDLASQVADADDLHQKFHLIYENLLTTARKAQSVLERDDLDEATIELLTEIHSLHKKNAVWCRYAIIQCVG